MKTLSLLSLATVLFMSSCSKQEAEVAPLASNTNSGSKLEVKDWSKAADGLSISPKTNLNLSSQNTFLISPTLNNIQMLKNGESFVVQVSKDNKTWTDQVYSYSKVQLIQGINDNAASALAPVEIVLGNEFKSNEPVWIKVGTRKLKAPVTKKVFEIETIFTDKVSGGRLGH